VRQAAGGQDRHRVHRLVQQGAFPVPTRLSCGRSVAGLGPGTVRVFCERWWAWIPLPLTEAEADRAPGTGVGYWWDIATRRVEVWRAFVFDALRQGRAFFEALVADILDLGQPGGVEVIFGRCVESSGLHRMRSPREWSSTGSTSPSTPSTSAPGLGSTSRTTASRGPRAPSTTPETWVSSTGGCLEHVGAPQARDRDVNRRLVQTNRVGQGCVHVSPDLEGVA
jgi:hypothetical protein